MSQEIYVPVDVLSTLRGVGWVEAIHTLGVSFATLLIALDKDPATILQRLFVGTDGAFILGAHFLSFSPLPVVVAIVVDLLDCDRRFSRNVVREVV